EGGAVRADAGDQHIVVDFLGGALHGVIPVREHRIHAAQQTTAHVRVLGVVHGADARGLDGGVLQAVLGRVDPDDLHGNEDQQYQLRNDDEELHHRLSLLTAGHAHG